MSRRKLLLADDSITIQKVVNLTFADEGVDVITVGDGNAALAELSSGLPDILLADVNMPGPNGYEICEQLRSSEASRSLPVILLVGSFEPFDEAEASRVGANAYLTKPFQSIRQLVSQVNELIEAANPPVEEHSGEGAAILESEVVGETIDQASLSDTVEMSSPGIDSSLAENEAEVAAESAGEPASDEIVDARPRYFDDLGYETTLPPADPAPAVEPADEIESLYAQSISSGDDGLSDVGIDDEMIETSYSVESASNDLADFRSEVEADSGSYDPGPSYAESSVESVPETAGSEAPVFSSGYEQRFPEDPSKFENTISYQNWQPADMRSGDGQPAAAEAQKSFETTRLDESFPQENEGVTPSPTIGEDTIRMESRFETTGSAFQFDDVNLLDLSQNAEAPVEITSPVNAVEQGSSKQVVTLSPELIEMIAQRVVEKLSEKY